MESFRSNLSENIFSKIRNLSEWNPSERIFQKIYLAQLESFRMESFRRNLSKNIFSKTGIFQNGIFQKIFSAKPESFRMESFRRNLSELTFWPNRNLSEWNHSEGIFLKIFSAKLESCRMESFRRNLSENIFCKTGIFQNGIFQKESFRNNFMTQ
jgi:hypothetical protein